MEIFWLTCCHHAAGWRHSMYGTKSISPCIFYKFIYLRRIHCKNSSSRSSMLTSCLPGLFRILLRVSKFYSLCISNAFEKHHIWAALRMPPLPKIQTCGLVFLGALWGILSAHGCRHIWKPFQYLIGPRHFQFQTGTIGDINMDSWWYIYPCMIYCIIPCFGVNVLVAVP